jgi:putative ABC transport system permease protein
MLSDLRYACRQLAKAPGFTAVIAATLALAIGACTIVFSTVSSILYDRAGEPEPGRIVRLLHSKPGQPARPGNRISLPDVLDVQRESKSFESIRASFSLTATLTGRGDPQPLQLIRTCFFGPRSIGGPFPGEEMTLGRRFLPTEYAVEKNGVIIVSYGFWENALAGNRGILGQTLIIDGKPHTIVGVAPRSFERFGGLVHGWVPNNLTDTSRGARYLDVTARLRPGVSLREAQAELDVIAQRLAGEYRETNQGYGLFALPEVAYANRNYTRALYPLTAAVMCVLLIACANIVNLTLVRAIGRQHEMAVRAALGATTPRLVGQLLLENLLVALLGGTAGVLLAQWGVEGVRVFAASGNVYLARLETVRIEWAVVGICLGLSVASGALFALAPAWLAWRVELTESLRHGARGATDSPARGRMRRWLVVFEIACAVILLAGAGVLLRSFLRLVQRDYGWDIEHVAIMQVTLNRQKYAKPEQRVAFADALLARLRALPGVESAALGGRHPFQLGGHFPDEYQLDRSTRAAPGSQVWATRSPATSDYFKTTGIRLLRGRLLDERDNASAPKVVAINEAMARLHFQSEDPVGRRLRPVQADSGDWREIVGVVRDVAGFNSTSDERTHCQVYAPFAQDPWFGFCAVVRMDGDPASILPLMRQQVYFVDKDQPVQSTFTASHDFGARIAIANFQTTLLAGFSLLALVIAAVGIYGVMAYSVSRRTAEFGIKMALGASQRTILREVLSQGTNIVAAGLLVGLGAALIAGRLIEAQLVDTSARDPLALVLVTIFLAAIGLLACWLPARRATRVNPVEALRAE